MFQASRDSPRQKPLYCHIRLLPPRFQLLEGDIPLQFDISGDEHAAQATFPHETLAVYIG